jgi:hypothetical protein
VSEPVSIWTTCLKEAVSAWTKVVGNGVVSMTRGVTGFGDGGSGLCGCTRDGVGDDEVEEDGEVGSRRGCMVGKSCLAAATSIAGARLLSSRCGLGVGFAERRRGEWENKKSEEREKGGDVELAWASLDAVSLSLSLGSNKSSFLSTSTDFPAGFRFLVPPLSHGSLRTN